MTDVSLGTTAANLGDDSKVLLQVINLQIPVPPDVIADIESKVLSALRSLLDPSKFRQEEVYAKVTTSQSTEIAIGRR